MNSSIKHFFLSALFFIAYVFSVSLALITDLTIEVKPGKNECLYQFVRAKTTFEVEYQVGLIANLGPRPSLGYYR